MNQLSTFRTAAAALLFSLYALVAYAQPTVMSLNQDVGGPYANTTMTLVGAAFKLRVQEDAVGTSSGTRNWQFNSDSYFNQWGTLAAAGVQTLAGYNTVIAPNAATASGNWTAAAYNSNGRLPATLANNYYTYTIMKGTSYASQRMSVLETSYNPVNISTVTQAAGTFGSRIVTITTSGTPDAAENIFVRYSTNSYVASTIVQATGSGTTWTATIPAQSAAVSFYVYSSNRSKATIDADVTSFSTQEIHDLSTLNLNNNSGSNYSYFPVNVTSTSGSSTSASYATLALAITAINGGMVHTGTIVCTVNDGYTETAPAGGFSITASGTVSNTITFTRSNSAGSRPIFTAPTTHTSGVLHDAIFEIIGGDFITIDGLEMRENAANITTAAGTNNMTEFGVALFYATTTNGAQNNTIQNNVITLNRTYQNTFGIYSNSTHSATTLTSATATTTAGGNSGLKIYGNSISNANMAIVVIGPTAATDMNNGIDIGGSTAGTGNTISNIGTTATFSSYANLTGTANVIVIRNSYNVNCSYNSITSSNGGVTAATTFTAINLPTFSTASTAASTNTINNNTFSMTHGAIGSALNGIIVPSTSFPNTATLNINNNNFTTMNYSATATGVIQCIANSAAVLNSSLNGNAFTNLTVNTSGNFTFLANGITCPAGGTKTANSNSIVTAFNKIVAGGTVSLYTDAGSSTTGTSVQNNNNNFSNITVTGATTITGWFNSDGTGSTPQKTITGNTFNNWTCGSGNVTILQGNDGGTATYSNNTITNISGGGSIIGLSIGNGGTIATMTISNNTITGLSSTVTNGVVTGILSASGATITNHY